MLPAARLLQPLARVGALADEKEERHREWQLASRAEALGGGGDRGGLRVRGKGGGLAVNEREGSHAAEEVIEAVCECGA